MMKQMKFSHHIKKYVEPFKHPNEWLHGIISNQEKNAVLIVITFAFLILGIILEQHWPFPYFEFFTSCFFVIGVLGAWTIAFFSEKMKGIAVAIANQPAAKKANYFYFRYCKETPLYFLCPIIVILIFGIGGCSMFGAMELNPTLIWVLILFILTVYISIIGYVQYIVLALYIKNLACGSGDYRRLSKSAADCFPTQLDWLQNITKLSHTYRSVFFTIGCAFIIAFGAFCWLPDTMANTDSPAFLFLWGIIFLALVMVFPTVSVMEHQWIKTIVGHLKASYIKDLTTEKELSDHAPIPSPSIQKLVEALYATQILNSKDYPLKSAWATGYAVVLSLVNFTASVATITQQISIFSNVFPQIF